MGEILQFFIDGNIKYILICFAILFMGGTSWNLFLIIYLIKINKNLDYIAGFFACLSLKGVETLSAEVKEDDNKTE